MNFARAYNDYKESLEMWGHDESDHLLERINKATAGLTCPVTGLPMNIAVCIEVCYRNAICPVLRPPNLGGSRRESCMYTNLNPEV